MTAKIPRTVFALLYFAFVLWLPITAFCPEDPPESDTVYPLEYGESEYYSPEQSENGDQTQEAAPETTENMNDQEPGNEPSEGPADELPPDLPHKSAEEQEQGLPQSHIENISEYMAEGENPAALYTLASNERVVRTFAQLSDALATNNGVTTVYLGDNIVMKGGVIINNNKTHVVVDGIDPTNPDQAEPYTLTDFNSALITDTIYINSSGVKNVLVRDLKIIGKNYYSTFSALDVPATSGLSITFERVDYNGPQIGYNRRGTISFTDCNAQLHGGNGICPSQEFSEAKNLIFEGVNTISTASTANSIFWHPQGGNFTIADDSSVELVSPNTSSLYGMFYAGDSTYKIGITIGQRSDFNATISNAASSEDYASLSGLIVREGGSFHLTTTGAADKAVLAISGNITVEPDAYFKITPYGSSGYPALDLQNGDIAISNNATFHIVSSNTSSSLLNLHGRSLICNNPSSVLFYNPGNRDIIATSSPGRIYINAEQINYWDAPSDGGLDNPPLYCWKKADGTNIWIDGTLGIGQGGNFSSISSNYSAGDSPGTAPSATNFNMVPARVLAFGRLELIANAPSTSSTQITGVTVPGATVRASFTQQGTDYILPDATADEDGTFSIPLDIPLLSSTYVTVKSNRQYLTSTYTTTVSGTGEFTLTIPEELYFYTAALAPKTQLVNRLNTGWHITVSDTRETENIWSIFVSELEPLTPINSSIPPLEGSLVFVGEDGIATPLSTGGMLLVYRNADSSRSETVSINWPSNRGILARIPTGAAYKQAYVGVIEWSLADVP